MNITNSLIFLFLLIVSPNLVFAKVYHQKVEQTSHNLRNQLMSLFAEKIVN